MLSFEQLEKAHEQIREFAQELAGEIDHPEALSHAINACDNLLIASRVMRWSQEHWLSKALECSLKASSLDARWIKLSARIQTLLACHIGVAVA